MAVTSDISGWLDGIQTLDFRSVHDLYTAIRDEKSEDGFSCNKTNTGLFVHAGPTCDTLRIKVSGKCELLRKIEEKFCDGMTEENYYEFNLKMEGDD